MKTNLAIRQAEMRTRITHIPRQPILKRDKQFLKYVDKASSGCWLWIGGKRWNGYGAYRQDLAHRQAWRIFRGPIPAGLCVLHRCDMTACVNPEHLYLGTHAQNMHDKVVRGRCHKHVKHLSPAELDEMRELRFSGKCSYPELADMYGICITTVANLLTGHTRLRPRDRTYEHIHPVNLWPAIISHTWLN